MGSGSGVYKNRRLFHAQPGHASLIPVDGLLKADDYEDEEARREMEMVSPTTKKRVEGRRKARQRERRRATPHNQDELEEKENVGPVETGRKHIYDDMDPLLEQKTRADRAIVTSECHSLLLDRVVHTCLQLLAFRFIVGNLTSVQKKAFPFCTFLGLNFSKARRVCILLNATGVLVLQKKRRKLGPLFFFIPSCCSFALANYIFYNMFKV